MSKRFINFLFLLCLTVICSSVASAQIPDASTSSGKSKEEEMPKGFYESLAKKRIDAEKKEYEELLAKGEELVKISEDLDKSFEAKRRLTSEDAKKIEQLEKTVKKIRNDLGAKDGNNSTEDTDDVDKVKPLTPKKLVENIKDISSKLLSDLKKNSRHTISVFSLQSSNALLKMIKLLKFDSK